MNSKRTVVGVGVLTALIVVIGCDGGPPLSRHLFNDEIAIDCRKLSLAGISFNDSLKSYLTKGDSSSLGGAASKCKSAVDDLIPKWDKMKTPKNSGSAGPLLQQFRQYLKTQKQIAAIMVEIATLADQKNYQGVRQKVSQMQQLENQAWQMMQQKLEAFHKEHHFNPVDKYRE